MYLAAEAPRTSSYITTFWRDLIRAWIAKCYAGALEEDAQAADFLQGYHTRITKLEHQVGWWSMEIE